MAADRANTSQSAGTHKPRSTLDAFVIRKDASNGVKHEKEAAAEKEVPVEDKENSGPDEKTSLAHSGHNGRGSKGSQAKKVKIEEDANDNVVVVATRQGRASKRSGAAKVKQEDVDEDVVAPKDEPAPTPDAIAEEDAESEQESSSETESDSSEAGVDDSDDSDYTGSDNEGKRKRRSTPRQRKVEMGDEFKKHLSSGNGAVSDYERIRLENIRRNQELIAQLNLQELGQLGGAKSGSASGVKRKSSASTRPGSVSRKKSAASAVEVEPTRRSARVRGVKIGRGSGDADGQEDVIDEETAKAIKEEADRKQREKDELNKFRFGAIPIKVENGGDNQSTKEFLSMLQNIAASSSVEEDVKNVGAFIEDADDKQMQEFYEGVRKSKYSPEPIRTNAERIMCCIMHPDKSNLLSIMGDKGGNISFIDYAKYHKSVNNPDVDASIEGIYSLRPHGEGVNDVKLDSQDATKIYSCSYDGTIKVLDITQSSFDNMYSSANQDVIQSIKQDPDSKLLYGCTHSGGLILLDPRQRRPVFDDVYLSNKKISFLDINPVHTNYLATSGLRYTVDVWDKRFITSQDNHSKIIRAWEGDNDADMEANEGRIPGCIWSTTIGRAINNCSWSPDGSRLLTTSFDNAIRIFDRPGLPGGTSNSGGDPPPGTITISHNNKTGKWVSLLRARWNPNKSRDCFIVGNMKRAVDVYSGKTGAMLSMLYDEDVVTAIPAVNAFHPNWLPEEDLITSTTATGKVWLWTSRQETDGDDL